jgi:hypothetical protein
VIAGSPLLVYAYKRGAGTRRFEWVVSLRGSLLVGRYSYATRGAATRAGKRAWNDLRQAIMVGDMS